MLDEPHAELLNERHLAMLNMPLEQLSPEQCELLIEFGKHRGLKIHKFKRTMSLARVRGVLGILHNIQPRELLDIGSGRGAFVWPFLEEFSNVPITCVDLNELRVRDILAVREGGVSRLNGLHADIIALNLPAKSFDVVTFLEALEHIPDTQKALTVAMKIARRFVIISVPSHEDDNEEHIHLFSKQSLSEMLLRASATNVNIQYVHNHMIAVVNLGR